MNAQNVPLCSWKSWMSLDVQVLVKKGVISIPISSIFIKFINYSYILYCCFLSGA